MSVNHNSVHVSRAESTTVDVCCFCGNGNLKNVWQLQKDPEIQLRRCLSCFAVSASHLPDSAFLHNYYSNYYSTQTQNHKITFHGEQRFAKHIFHYLPEACVKSSVKILDFGGGDGALTIALAKRFIAEGVKNVDIAIVDVVAPVKSDVAAIHILSFRELKEISSASRFDVVIASAVIEHLNNPGAVLKDIFSRMDSGSVFYARTPWALPLARFFKPFGIRWNFSYPAHLHDLGQDFWEHFANKNPNLNILASRPSLVETSLRTNALRTVVAAIFKFPKRLFRKSYKMVGGWEIFIQIK